MQTRLSLCVLTLVSAIAAGCQPTGDRGRTGDRAGEQPPAGSTSTAVMPTMSGASEGFTMLSVSVHACGLDGEGRIHCWGPNGDGQLGTGELGKGTNAPVPLPFPTRFISVSTGDDFTCAVSEEGRAYCWGANGEGQLGDGSLNGHPRPTALPGLDSLREVSAGSAIVCALTRSGAAYCWGGYDVEPILAGHPKHGSRVPVLLPGGRVFRSLSVGNDYSACGVDVSGKAYCWGPTNEGGELGTGDTTSSEVPVAVAGGHAFRQVSVGNGSACGVTTTNQTYCWGSNYYGQLGTGTQSRHETAPTAVAGGLAFSAVSAGSLSTCGLTTAGQAYCWGMNAHGELGTGDTTIRRSPAAVVGGHTFRYISAGTGASTCGLTTTGALYCWGARIGGQSSAPESVPYSTTPQLVRSEQRK